MQADRDAELAQGLEGLLERDAAPLDLEPVLAEEGGHVGPAHRPEEPPLVGGLPALGERERLDSLRLRLGRRPQRGGLAVLARLDRERFLRFAGVALSASFWGKR